MLQQFLQEFGYFALFLGTFFEGETILVLAGFLAFRGYMDLKLVMIVAFLGSYAGDQLWYFLGRKHGRKLLARKPRWQLMGDKALEHIRRHPDIWVLSFRFVYGLRTVMPVAIGLSGYPPRRYLLLNKPRGLVTTRSDERGRDTVYALLGDAGGEWLAPVGRLDKASEGALLFTNDSAWAAAVTARGRSRRSIR